MKKFFALFVILALTLTVATQASAQIRFKDVPEDHWAASYVYDLVKLGVTNGYPDGTFRGKNNITRYETAVLMAKLAKVIGGGAGNNADIAALRSEIAAMKKSPMSSSPLSGAYMASWKFGNLLAEKGGIRGAVADYRLKLTSVSKLGNGATVKINLDTMDYGFFNDGQTATGGVLATELLDITSTLTLNMGGLGIPNPVDLTATFGPGNKVHAADPAGVIPSEIGVTYMRPDTGIMAATNMWGMDLSGGYTAIGHATSGRVTVSDIMGSLAYEFRGAPLVDKVKFVGTGQYVSAGQYSSSTRDVRATISAASPLGDKIEAVGTLGLGASDQKAWMIKTEFAFNDIWDTGTVAIGRFSKVGSQFLSADATLGAAEWDFAGFDTFDRALTPGTVNVGGEVVQTVSNDLRLVGKGDIRLNSDYKYETPNGRLTAQGGVSYLAAPNTTLDAFYRINQDESAADKTTDVAAVGLMYQF